MSETLVSKTCTPCRGGIPPLQPGLLAKRRIIVGIKPDGFAECVSQIGWD